MAMVLTYVGDTAVVSSSGIGSVTFTSAAIGTAAPDKIVIFGVTTEVPTDIPSVTFNGVAGKREIIALSSAAPFNISAIFTSVQTSSTCNIVVTVTTTAASNVTASIWSLLGADYARAGSVSTGPAGSGTTCQVTGPTIPSGGVAVYVFNNATAGTAVTWTRANERSDKTATTYRHSAADLSSLSGSTTHIADGATANQSLVGVTWGNAVPGFGTVSANRLVRYSINGY